MSYKEKYIKYKNKYLNAKAGNDRLNYRDSYLQAIENNTCPKVDKIEEDINKIYTILEKKPLVSRYLFLKNSDFREKYPHLNCESFWEPLEIKSNYIQNLVYLLSGEKIADIETCKDKLKDMGLGQRNIDIFRKGEFLTFMSKTIPDLFLLIVNNPNNFLKLIYHKEKQKITLSGKDIWAKMLKSDKFNITNNLNESFIDECHLDTFFYDGKINPDLRDEIIKVINREYGHWTTWLLLCIISPLFNCLGCREVHLLDDSFLINKNCEPHTIIYQLAKNRKPMYQSIGFKAKPPINIKTVDKINYIVISNKDITFFDAFNPGFHFYIINK